MDTEALRSALENAGVTQYEADAYVALLEHGSATASELAAASDVPQTRIYDVVRDLADRGYVDIYQGEHMEVRANDPETVVEDLEAYAATFLDAADEVQERWTQPDVSQSKLNVVSRRETVLRQAREWIADAEYEIEMSGTPEQFEALQDALSAAHDRGVVSKLTLMSESDPQPGDGGPSRDGPEMIRGGTENRPFTDLADQFEDCATEVRHRELTTPFILVVDRVRTCFAPASTTQNPNSYGVVVEDLTLSRMFNWFFQTALWHTWETVYSDRSNAVPAAYANIRLCLHYIAPLVEDCEVVLSVEGFETDSGEPIELEGEVIDVVYADGDEPHPTLEALVSQATIWLETDEGVYSVGGWTAYMEDVEGQRFTVELVRR